jgi:UDP-glucose 4-epimerase
VKIGITGSNGFVGSHLIEFFKNQAKFEIIEISRNNGFDILNPITLFELNDINLIIHLAGKSYVPDSYLNPFDFYQNNVSGMINILELCRRNNAKLIFASSYLYGEPSYLPIDEYHKVVSTNPYAETKLISEQLCNSYSKYHGVKCCILRIFNLYGPKQNDAFLIPKIIKQASTGYVRLADPSPKRDFLFIDDLVNLFKLIIESHFNFNFEIFNVGYGKSYSIQEIINNVRKNFTNEFSVDYTYEKRLGEISETLCNNSKVKSEFQWNPKINLEAGISNIIKSNK